ncbi:MAG: hypothetical protein UMS36scaffold28_62 [Phage 59_13]|nr:MAG: hypothetical protein UMS36scaffold28_62 [Phage 59_13]
MKANLCDVPSARKNLAEQNWRIKSLRGRGCVGANDAQPSN